MLGMGALRRHSGRGYRPEHPRTSRRAPAPPCGAAVPSAPPPSAPPAITSPLALRLCRYKRRSRGAVTGLCARNLQVLSVRTVPRASASTRSAAGTMREIVHIQAGQCGNQIGTKVRRARRGRAACGLERPPARVRRGSALRSWGALEGRRCRAGRRTAGRPCRSLPSPPRPERPPQARARLEFARGGRQPRPARTGRGRGAGAGGRAPWAPVSDLVSPRLALHQVLGSDQRRAWYRPGRRLRGRFGAAAGENQRLLQ